MSNEFGEKKIDRSFKDISHISTPFQLNAAEAGEDRSETARLDKRKLTPVPRPRAVGLGCPRPFMDHPGAKKKIPSEHPLTRHRDKNLGAPPRSLKRGDKIDGARRKKAAFAELEIKTPQSLSPRNIRCLRFVPLPRSTQQLAAAAADVNIFLRILCDLCRDIPAPQKYGFALSPRALRPRMGLGAALSPPPGSLTCRDLMSFPPGTLRQHRRTGPVMPRAWHRARFGGETQGKRSATPHFPSPCGWDGDVKVCLARGCQRKEGKP